MRRLLLMLGVVLALALAGPPLVTAQDEATPSAEPGVPGIARTNIRYLLPFTPDGLNPALAVSATESGVCDHASVDALDRPDAWNCISESDILYDPCFENPFVGDEPDAPAEVACFESPFSPDVVLLTLTKPLVREKETNGAATAPDPAQSGETTALDPWDLPWALELANGEQCTLMGGTVPVVAGQAANYGCADGGMVLGRTDRGQPVWVVNYIAEGDYASTLAEVAIAWS